MAITKIGELHSLVLSAVLAQGFDRDTARAMADEFVAAEIAGTTTHGVTKLVSLNLGDLDAEPAKEQMGSVQRVNGGGTNGFTLFNSLAEDACKIAAELGFAVIFARNFSRYSGLYPYTEKIAERGFIGILMNGAGPAAVAPFGGVDPITGTNPISFSFPTTTGVQTFDFSTAAVVWGAIRQAAVEERDLPSGAFLDARGQETVDPHAVAAVRSFGGTKGFALNLAIELLCGAAAGAAMGGKVESEFDLGAVLIAIDPRFTGGEGFADAASALFEEIRQSRPESPATKVHVPGDRLRGKRLLDAVSPDHPLTIPDLTLEFLTRMSAGESVQSLSSNPLFN